MYKVGKSGISTETVFTEQNTEKLAFHSKMVKHIHHDTVTRFDSIIFGARFLTLWLCRASNFYDVFFWGINRMGRADISTKTDNPHWGYWYVRVELAAISPLQTTYPCFCVELNSEIKFDKSTAEARRANHQSNLKLSSISFAVLYDSGTVAIQTPCLCRAKQNS